MRPRVDGTQISGSCARERGAEAAENVRDHEQVGESYTAHRLTATQNKTLCAQRSALNEIRRSCGGGIYETSN